MYYSLIILTGVLCFYINNKILKAEINNLRNRMDREYHSYVNEIQANHMKTDQVISDLSSWVTVRYEEIGVNETVELLNIIHADLRPTSGIH